MRFHFASSGTLARQIAAGAPADLFISASPAWMDYLEGRGLIAPGSRRPVARNALACAVPLDSGPRPEGPGDLLRLRRISVGDPAHVPAGAYARRALEAAGAWRRLEEEGRLVFAKDARGALAFVERGEVPAGIVYLTDAKRSRRVRLAFVFPEGAAPPILYLGGAVAGRPRAREAAAFLAFLGTAAARAIWEEGGFLPPPARGAR